MQYLKLVLGFLVYNTISLILSPLRPNRAQQGKRKRFYVLFFNFIEEEIKVQTDEKSQSHLQSQHSNLGDHVRISASPHLLSMPPNNSPYDCQFDFLRLSLICPKPDALFISKALWLGDWIIGKDLRMNVNYLSIYLNCKVKQEKKKWDSPLEYWLLQWFPICLAHLNYLRNFKNK